MATCSCRSSQLSTTRDSRYCHPIRTMLIAVILLRSQSGTVWPSRALDVTVDPAHSDSRRALHLRPICPHRWARRLLRLGQVAMQFRMFSRALLLTGVIGVSACGASAPSVEPAAVDRDASVSATDTMDATPHTDANGSGACESSGDCIDFSAGPAVTCCISNTCIYGQAAIDAVPCTDADVQLVLSSDYDQSCQIDSDCMPVAEGNFCMAGANNCASAAINQRAYAQYQTDVAKTNAAICRAITSCPNEHVPCCRGGLCHTGTECSD
jgi:hypothetical protein